jgi:toxin ParE1/3/4
LPQKIPQPRNVSMTEFARFAKGRIGRFPQGFQEVAERPGVRRVPLVRYPYLIFYKIFADEVVVLRVVHGARKEPWENL